MFVHIVQWSDISHFCVQLPLKSPQNWLFWLKIVRKISSPTNFTTWNHDFICIFTSYKLQKCEKYNLPQIHHIRTYCNSEVLWSVIIVNCVHTGHILMNCMVLYAQFRYLLYIVVGMYAKHYIMWLIFTYYIPFQ